MLKGLRFQKRISILPGVRLNLSRRGASASVGPRGADVNIGREGMTTNAGIPGSGLSWRSKLGTHGSWFGVVLLVGALAFWAGKHMVTTLPPAMPVATKSAPMTAQAVPQDAPPVEEHHTARAPRKPLAPGLVFVHRAGSVLRETEKSSGKSLKKEPKGARIRLLQLDEDGWAKVQDDDTTGFMRAGTLGMEAPKQ